MSTNGLAKWTFSETAGAVPIKLVKVTDDETLFRHWPWLEARLKVIKKKDLSREHWTPAHIRQGIQNGFRGASVVELWLGVNSESVVEGFVITTIRGDPYIQMPVALVAWMLWSNEKLTAQVLPQLEEIAKRRYLSRIEFPSGRKGWMLKAGRFGFKLGMMTFYKDL